MRLPLLRRPFDVSLAMPGSKSHANRALIAAALAERRTVLRGVTPCEDVDRMIEHLGRLGFALRRRADGAIEVDGGLPTGSGRATLDCGNAGTTLRFLTALCSLIPGTWTLTGNERMRARPIGELVDALRALGATIEVDGDHPPVTVRGGTLRGGRIAVDTRRSSQFASALLLIAPAVPGGIEVERRGEASEPYVELTRGTVEAFAAEPTEHVVEGDWSAAGALLVLAALTGSRFVGTNLSPSSSQADRELPKRIEAMRAEGSLVVDCRAIPDQMMNLAVLAARRRGTTRFVGAANLRLKECDRLAVLTGELRKAGIDIAEHEDGVLVRPSPSPRGARLSPHGDHRMAMAFAILGSLVDGIEIEDPGCVDKSYPAFFCDLDRARRSPRCVALVGMRGAGKSALGAALAEAWACPGIDADAEFESRYGPIARFLRTHGWDAFRAREAELLPELLRPGRIVATGGGAILTPAQRTLLRERALVVFVDEDPALLRERIEASDRPSLTGAGRTAEVAPVLDERRPLYEETAHFVLPPRQTISERVAAIDRECRALCSWERPFA